MAYGVIYKITNKLNGHSYIGQTIQKLNERWSNHISESKHLNRKIHQALRKYGRDNFEICIIDECNSKEELNIKEAFWVNFYDTYKHGYNSTLGGDFNPMLIDEFRQKVIKQLTGRKRNFTPEQRIQYAERILKQGKQFKSGNEHPLSKIVYKINPESFIIEDIFENIISAELKINNKNMNGITNALKSKFLYRGYYWISKEDYNLHSSNLSLFFNKTPYYNNKTKILQFDLNGSLLKEWNSIKEAELSLNGKKTGNISACVQGKTKTAFKFIWKYAS
jgi:hypothetical protein